MARLVRHEATGSIRIDPQTKPIFVCACGISKSFPLCDGSHKKCREEEAGHCYRYDPTTHEVVEKKPESSGG